MWKHIKVLDNIMPLVAGFTTISLISGLAYYISLSSQTLKSFGIGSLVIGILIGICFGNTVKLVKPNLFNESITFCSKRILRLAIILYGFNITYSHIMQVGPSAILTSIIMLLTTFALILIIGLKVFKLDKQLTILIAAGASICGAAAVLATESQLKASSEKTSVAIITVVLFGTTSMLLYPLLYKYGYLSMSPDVYGIYVGSSIHEVAQVVVAADSIPGASDNAVIVKMIRVLLLPIVLLGIGFSCRSKKSKFNIPWFAVMFIGVAVFNSFQLLPQSYVNNILWLDKILLTIAMTALGMSTNLVKVFNAGYKPLLTALIAYAWLVVGGYYITVLLTRVL